MSEFIFSCNDWLIETRKREDIVIFYIENKFDKDNHTTTTSNLVIDSKAPPFIIGPSKEFLIDILKVHYPECLI